MSVVSLREKNLPVLAQRLKWPAGALEAVQEIEAEFGRYLAWWSPAAGAEIPASTPCGPEAGNDRCTQQTPASWPSS